MFTTSFAKRVWVDGTLPGQDFSCKWNPLCSLSILCTQSSQEEIRAQILFLIITEIRGIHPGKAPPQIKHCSDIVQPVIILWMSRKCTWFCENTFFYITPNIKEKSFYNTKNQHQNLLRTPFLEYSGPNFLSLRCQCLQLYPESFGKD